MASRTKYIGVGTTILTVALFISWFIASDNFDVEISGDYFCQGTENDLCRIDFNITSKYYVYYLYNKEGIKLEFLPEIEDYWICKPDMRCKSCGKCPAGMREIDFASPYTSRYKYVYKFYKGEKEQFSLFGLKRDPEDVVKWTLNAVGEEKDPKWIPKLSILQDCKTTYWDETIPIYSEEKLHLNGTIYKEKIGETTCQKSKQDCEKIGYNYMNREIINEWNCDLNKLLCDSCRDGNCDGIVQSGESYLDLKNNIYKLDDRYRIFK